MIRARLRQRALVLHQRVRNRVYDLWTRHGFPDHAEQLRQAQLRCNEAQPDVEPELWKKGDDYIVKEIEKPAWTLKIRRGPEEIPYSAVRNEPREPSELEEYILAPSPGEALNGHAFEYEMGAGCRNTAGDVSCELKPECCERVPPTGCPQLREELA
jgi:hypothetical protein